MKDGYLTHLTGLYEALTSRDLNVFMQLLHRSTDTKKVPYPIEALISRMMTKAYQDYRFDVNTSNADSFTNLSFKYLSEMASAYPESFRPIDWGKVNNEYVAMILVSQAVSEEPIHFFPIQLLVDHFPDYDINAANAHGVTPLMGMVAAEFSKAEDIECLLAMGADIHLKSQEHGRAIHCLDIYQEDGEPFAKMLALLNAGADPVEPLRYVTNQHNTFRGLHFQSFLHYVEETAKRAEKDNASEVFYDSDKPTSEYIKVIKHYAAAAAAEKVSAEHQTNQRKGRVTF